MTVHWQIRPEPGPDADAVVIPACSGRLPGHLSAAFLAGTGFSGAIGEVLQVPGAAGEPVTVLLGFGPDPVPGRAAIRTAAACLARAVSGYPRLAIMAPSADLRPLAEGYLLGGYRFTRHRSCPAGPSDQRIEVIVPEVAGGGAEVAGNGGELADVQMPGGAGAWGGAVARGSAEARGGAEARGSAEARGGAGALADGQRLAGAVALARDLVNEPGGALTPRDFADRAQSVAAESGLDCEVWDADRIAAERLGGLLGVARGSLEPPRLVRLAYRPNSYRRSQRRIALVGKGVTFDSGGMSLKPTAQLVEMKADMAGAAAVLGAMSVLDGMDCPVAVDGWLPLTENMANADPVRVGDVLVMRDGTTVEVRNADAEGRLILADALVLAGESKPDAIIDIATLTDAAVVALGRRIAAVMSTDDALAGALRAAGERAGEPNWPLPLPDRYRRQLESRVADLVNYTTGTRHGTALLAGLFLREFVPPGIPWAHLDIQGTALCDADDGEWVAGGTGFGVRTLVELLLSS